jgi:hypothetical protein
MQQHVEGVCARAEVFRHISLKDMSGSGWRNCVMSNPRILIFLYTTKKSWGTWAEACSTHGTHEKRIKNFERQTGIGPVRGYF